MNKLQKILGIGVIALSSLGTLGCREVKASYSDIMYEQAVVTEMNHTSDNKKWEISFEGEVNFKINSEKIFKYFKKGDTADIFYIAVYDNIYEDINRDFKTEFKESKLKSYFIIDVYPEGQFD